MCVCCGAPTLEIIFFDHAVDDRQPRRVAGSKEEEALVAHGHPRVQEERVSLQENIVVWREVGVQAFKHCQQKQKQERSVVWRKKKIWKVSCLACGWGESA